MQLPYNHISIEIYDACNIRINMYITSKVVILLNNSNLVGDFSPFETYESKPSGGDNISHLKRPLSNETVLGQDTSRLWAKAHLASTIDP